jgi:protein-disulfide isomerase
MITPTKLRTPVSDSDHTHGRADAPAVLVEYGDYQCGFCGSAFPVVKRLEQALSRDLLFVFRNFPLPQLHPQALPAALAAEAAAMQGKFWQMHDQLYRNQADLGPELYRQTASSLGLDIPRFLSDLADRDLEARVRQDFYGGVRSGVNGTPSFFINEYLYQGPISFPALLAELRSVAGPSEAVG